TGPGKRTGEELKAEGRRRRAIERAGNRGATARDGRGGQNRGTSCVTTFVDRNNARIKNNVGIVDDCTCAEIGNILFVLFDLVTVQSRVLHTSGNVNPHVIADCLDIDSVNTNADIVVRQLGTSPTLDIDTVSLVP